VLEEGATRSLITSESLGLISDPNFESGVGETLEAILAATDVVDSS